jgi:hypothetical protein
MRYSWIITLLLFALLSGGWADDSHPWSFRFGVGSLFPDASEIIDPNSPNGLNISASMAYRYNSWLVLQGTAHFDYFSDDKRLDFRTYIIIFNTAFETRIHPLKTSSKISPYLIGGIAPAVYLNTLPYVPAGEELDPYTTRRDYDLQFGFNLKYGLGTTIYLGEDIRLWAEWQYSRFGFFKNRDPIKYRAFLIGLLLDVQWLQ